MNVIDAIEKLEPAVIPLGGAVFVGFVGELPAECPVCGVDVTPENRHHKGVWIRGKRVNMIHVRAFCSAVCREAWWCSGSDVDLFPIHSPIERDCVDPQIASFFYASPEDSNWRSGWAQSEFDTNFVCTVFEQSLAEVLYRIVFWDGSTTPVDLEHKAAVEFVLDHGPELFADQIVVGIEMLWERVREQRQFATPRDFNLWWRAALTVEKHREEQAEWRSFCSA